MLPVFLGIGKQQPENPLVPVCVVPGYEDPRIVETLDQTGRGVRDHWDAIDTRLSGYHAVRLVLRGHQHHPGLSPDLAHVLGDRVDKRVRREYRLLSTVGTHHAQEGYVRETVGQSGEQMNPFVLLEVHQGYRSSRGLDPVSVVIQWGVDREAVRIVVDAVLDPLGVKDL